MSMEKSCISQILIPLSVSQKLPGYTQKSDLRMAFGASILSLKMICQPNGAPCPQRIAQPKAALLESRKTIKKFPPSTVCRLQIIAGNIFQLQRYNF